MGGLPATVLLWGAKDLSGLATDVPEARIINDNLLNVKSGDSGDPVSSRG